MRNWNHIMAISVFSFNFSFAIYVFLFVCVYMTYYLSLSLSLDLSIDPSGWIFQSVSRLRIFILACEEEEEAHLVNSTRPSPSLPFPLSRSATPEAKPPVQMHQRRDIIYFIFHTYIPMLHPVRIPKFQYEETLPPRLQSQSQSQSLQSNLKSQISWICRKYISTLLTH